MHEPRHAEPRMSARTSILAIIAVEQLARFSQRAFMHERGVRARARRPRMRPVLPYSSIRVSNGKVRQPLSLATRNA
jgi:hypothetical protein